MVSKRIWMHVKKIIFQRQYKINSFPLFHNETQQINYFPWFWHGSKTKFTNSLNSQKQGKCLRVGIRAQGGRDSLKKTQTERSHATVSLRGYSKVRIETCGEKSYELAKSKGKAFLTAIDKVDGSCHWYNTRSIRSCDIWKILILHESNP